MSVYREWRERVAKAWHDPTDTSGEVRDEPHDDGEYTSLRGYAGRPGGVVWGTVNPDGSVTARGFRDDESYSEDTAVHPAMSMVAYRAEADTWVHMATGQTTERQREIDAERAEREAATSSPYSPEHTARVAEAKANLDAATARYRAWSDGESDGGGAEAARDFDAHSADYRAAVNAAEQVADRPTPRLGEQPGKDATGAKFDPPPAAQPWSAKGADVNEATKGVVEGVSTVTPTGLATSAASGMTGKDIKSPLAAAATGGGTSGGSGAMASVEEVRAAIDQAMQKADSAGGAVQQAQSDLEEAQAQLAQATEGSGKSEFSEANALLAQAVASIAEVQQSVQAARDAAETGAGQL